MNPDLCYVCMMLTAAKSWSTVVGSTAGFLLPLYRNTVFLLPENTLSRLKTLRFFVNYFACSRYIWSLVHSLPQHAGKQIPEIHDKKHRSTELPGSCLTAQDCADTCVWAATL